jgi:AraC-like DNA-binding protein
MSHTFRDTFGETPHRYLQRRRVEPNRSQPNS